MKKLMVSFFIITTFLLNGCTFYRATVANDAAIKMIGFSKEDTLACMGSPENKEIEGEIEVWKYSSGGGVDTDNYNYSNSDSNFSLIGNAIYGASNHHGYAHTRSRVRYCVINIVFKDDRVYSVNYSGRTGGILTKNQECYYAIENCK